MENDFRNLTAKVWSNLDNPIKSYDFSKFWLISCMHAVLSDSGGTVLISVMSQQYNCLMELCTNFTKFFTFHEDASSLYFVRDKMIVHAFMIEHDQLDY